MKTERINLQLPEEEYRALRAVSNSELTRLRDRLYERKRPVSKTVLQLGSAFHQAVLEPNRERRWQQEIDWEIVEQLQANLQKNREFEDLLARSETEVSRLWTDETTGLTCKARLDVVSSDGIVADLKTTSCLHRADFINNCQRYDYDRQAAFYLDSFAPDERKDLRFVFFGVQKVFPYDIFTYEVGADDAFLAYGRNKYQSLLNIWKSNHQPNYDTLQNRNWLVLD